MQHQLYQHERTLRRLTLRSVTLLYLLLSCTVGLGLAAHPLYAQTTNEPPLTIVGVDTQQLPTITLVVDGADWPSTRAATPLQVFVDGEEQTEVSDQLTTEGISFMVAINPNDLLESQAGQTRYVQMTGAMLNLIDNDILERYQDWIAAYLLLPTEVQSIQDWTQEPNTVFNSIALNRPPVLTDTPLATSTLVAALEQFEASPAAATQPRALLLISTQTQGLDVAAVVEAAQRLFVQIHVVELPGGENLNADNTELAQVARQTGGDYIVLDNPNALPPLWERIDAEHSRRMLTFQSTVTAPQQLEVRLQLPEGELLTATATTDLAATRAPASPATSLTEAPSAAPTAQTVMTSSETTTAAADTTAATVSEASAPTTQPTTQPTAEAVALAQPAAGQPLPSSETDAGQPADGSGAVVMPGLPFTIPRTVLLISLGMLVVLISYFVYAEVKDRRQKQQLRSPHNPQYSNDRYQAPDHFMLDENSQALSVSPFQLNTRDPKGEQGAVVDTPAPKLAPPPRTPAQAPVRPPARSTTFAQEEDEGEATMRPRLVDDEATYRVQEVEQPTIGYLIRATSDPNLPKELPVYGLSPAPGEVRQIHIGRHSKHNTVVINDKSISREHAVIIQREGRLYLRDNASTSGTFLNWKRLNPGEELLLRHNDLISFGQIVYEFRLQGEDEVTIG